MAIMHGIPKIRQLINRIPVKTKAAVYYEVIIEIAFSLKGSAAIVKKTHPVQACWPDSD
jgi:hypothetical protein